MSGRFKSNPFFMERIKIVKDIKESVETFSIISKREGIADHFTMFVYDETVVFKLRQVQADETGHNDTSYKHLYCMIDTCLFQSNYAFVMKPQGLTYLLTLERKRLW